jgi:hypothetical protein
VNAQRPLADRIDYFLAERDALNDHMRSVNERVERGETVWMNSVPVAPLEEGFALLREAAEALRG